MKDFFRQGISQKGYTFTEFNEKSRLYLERTDPETLDDKDKKWYDYKKINFTRTGRILKKFKADEELARLISSINTPQLWMVLTEDWCGDSAQNLPYLAKYVELNDKIDMRILERDNNLEIMDQYLTNGKSRSIPKMVAFDADGNELFVWGPRPKEAQELRDKLISEGKPGAEVTTQLHLWYAKNNGKALVAEFKKILGNLTIG